MAGGGGKKRVEGGGGEEGGRGGEGEGELGRSQALEFRAEGLWGLQLLWWLRNRLREFFNIADPWLRGLVVAVDTTTWAEFRGCLVAATSPQSQPFMETSKSARVTDTALGVTAIAALIGRALVGEQ